MLNILVLHLYWILSIFELLKGVDAILSKIGWLTEIIKESSNKKDFQNIPLNNFVEAKTTLAFLNKVILSDKDLDQLFDWKNLYQNISFFPKSFSFKDYKRVYGY